MLFLLSEGSHTVAEDYVNWIWHRMSMGCCLVVMLEKWRGVNYTLYNLGKVAGTCGESRLYLCCILYMWISMQMVIYPPYTVY